MATDTKAPILDSPQLTMADGLVRQHGRPAAWRASHPAAFPKTQAAPPDTTTLPAIYAGRPMPVQQQESRHANVTSPLLSTA